MASASLKLFCIGCQSCHLITEESNCECRVFYLVTYLWQMGVYIIFMLVFAIFGSAIGLKMFTKNSWGVQVQYLLAPLLLLFMPCSGNLRRCLSTEAHSIA